MSVSVIDINNKTLKPCSEKRARVLLNRKRANMIQALPCVIKILDRTQEECILESESNIRSIENAS